MLPNEASGKFDQDAFNNDLAKLPWEKLDDSVSVEEMDGIYT